MTSFLNLVGIYASAIEAKEALDEKDVDLIFLDVEMPNMTGMEFIQTFRDIPQIILVTAKKEYAFEAFKYDVTDYISKPINYTRFLQAAEKAQRINENIVSEGDQDDTIFIKSDLALVKVSLSEVNYIEALGDYVRVITDAEKYTVLSTMKAFEAKLSDKNFLRVHKSYIVRLDKIKQIEGNMVNLGKKAIPVSRTYKDTLLQRINML
ncbi:MAG: LytTR family DNA-binding domain-containing protein [Bacteroidota bacterium]